MANKDIGALVVTEGNQVVGILSERDCARKIIMRDLSADSTQVSELMTSAVISVRLNNTVEECLKLMTDRHLRHLPVLENDLLVGLVAIGDLVKATIEDQHDLIQQLQHYISH
jgi:CBS domain-containing protein